MLRRTFLLTGFSTLALAAGSAVGLTRTSVTAAGAFPWTPTSSTPTPTINANQVSPPGGLGNTRSDLESTYGNPDGLKGTMVSFQNGSVAASFEASRAIQLLITFNAPVGDLDQARARIKILVPDDSTPVGTMDVGATRVADIFHSTRLQQRVFMPTPGAPSGQYVVVYEPDSTGAIKAALLSVGNVPSTSS